jgi:hypothetical protein
MQIKNLFILLLLLPFQLVAQQSVDGLTLKINPVFNGKTLRLDQKYISGKQDTLTLDVVKFYVSAIEIKYKDNHVASKKNSFHLIDVSHPESLLINLDRLQYQEIRSIKFNLGIDSLTSVSGALNKDLDAANGMYWAWQSGYINMKIEGESSSCKTRKNKFHFHIGGYTNPNYAMRTIEILVPSTTNPNKTLQLNVDLSKLFAELELKEINSIMIPGKEAIKIADIAKKMFTLE